MICTSCGSMEAPKRPPHGARCSHCGSSEMKHETREAMMLAAEAIAIARVRELVAGWTNEGLIPRPSADEIQRRLTPPPPEPLQLPPPPEPQPPPPEVQPPPQWAYPQHEYRPEAIDQHVPDLPPAVGGLDAIAPLAALDAAPPTPRAPGKWETEVRPLLYENIGWFLGTLLVLAGSVYGVREAWRTLGGVARHVAVGGALFAYHAGFVGLAALLAKKSKGTGAVLGAIALGLSPIVFVALSSMVEASVAVGSIVALPFVIGSAFTLRSVGKRFDLENAWILPMTVMPALVAELPVGRSAPDSLARAALPFVGVVGARLALRGGSRAVDFASTYAAIALGLYAVVGGPTAAATGPFAAAAVPLFCAALAAVVASGVERPPVRAAFPRATSTITILALSVVLVSVVIATRHATGDAPRLALIGDAATALLACGTFLVIARSRPAALHVTGIVAPLAGWLLVRAMAPAMPQWWPFGSAVAAAIAIVLPQGARERRVLSGWGVVAALFALGCAPCMETIARERGHYVATFATALVIAVASHGAGGVQRRGLHYLGGLAVMSAAFAWLLPTTDDVGPTLIRIGLALAGGFAVAGVAFDVRAAILEDDEKRARPFEDLSGFALLLALIATLPPLRLAALFALDRGATPAATLRESTMLAVVGGAFVLRAARDRSSFPSLFGAGILGLWLYLAAGPRSAATGALTFGAIALGAATVASLRGFSPSEEKVSARRVFGVIPLPFSASGWRAVTDGFAHASWVATAMTLLSMFGWLTARVEADRSFAIQAGVCLVIVQILGFLAGTFTSYGLRGSVTSLSFIVTLIGFTAVVNRIGRPLPPPVVGYKLSAVAIAMWGVAIGAKRWGPGIGGALGDRPSGERYHVVFHVVVFLLATVLCIDALLLTGGRTHIALSAIPPLLLLGPAVVLVLEARTLETKELVHVAGPLAIAGAALISTQRSLLGSAPARIFPPEIAWSRGIFGVAVCGAILGGATLFARDREEAQPLSLWTLGVAFAVLACSWLRIDPIPSVLVLASGVLLALGRRHRAAQAAMFVGAFLIVHAVAQAAGVVPVWAGPAIATLAGAAWIASAVRRRESWLADLLFAAATIASLVYAFAQGADTSPVASGPALARAALLSLGGDFMRLRAIPLTAGIAGISLTITAFRTAKARAPMASFAGALLLGLAAATCATVASPPTNFPVRLLGPAVALAFALVAAIEQGVGSGLDAGERSSLGARVGRDLMLALVFTTGALFVLSRAPVAPAKSALVLGFSGLAVAAGTATVAAFRERSGRHVYYVQLAIVAAYALVRTELATAVPPEGDALFGLCLGFLLLGVTVHARRAGIPEVAGAVRTFVALLPIGIAIVLPKRASDSAALIAAASGALYGALAWLERNRLFGSLGAAACNVALLLLALSHGFDGGEVYLAAFGLFVLALGHLFASSMDHGARLAIRVIGGLFLYAPAAIRLTSQIATSPSGTYAIGFGAACLFGVILGMLLQIRAYLAFGTGFLVLDVIANLTAAGIRDHRIGFLVLSLAGLSILGTMVFVTLQRELVRSWGRSLRLALRGWD